MGWYAHLADYEWNFTHNTNGMIEWVLGDAVAGTSQPWWSKLGGHDGLGHGAWWDLLDGKTGHQAAPLLDGIVEGLSKQPNRFREMNPPNGWGNYDMLLTILSEMRDASHECPEDVWATGG